MRISWTIVLVSCALLLTGCSGVPVTTPVETASSGVPGAAIHGRVHGGQQPIVGASVYLYAANTTGYGNAAVSLLTSASGNVDGSGHYYVTSDSTGSFSITGDYTCPSTASQVYLYAVGGNPGPGVNSAAGLLAALGTCPASSTLSPDLYIVVNEVSTVATAYAIAGYATDATHVSSSGSVLATTGIQNAFATVTNLETLGTGLALTTTPAANGGNGTVPQSAINTLANILAACINSTGPSSTPCTTLLGNAMNGTTTPTDTATAAINIAHNPGANIAALYALQTGTPPFLPDLTGAPNDFTLAITYSGNGLDGTGSAPEGIAVDGAGNVWVPNFTSSTVSEFNSSGAAVSGSPYTLGGLNRPASIAIDTATNGNAWIVNEFGDSISEFRYDGTALSGTTGFTGGGLNEPYGIAFDSSGNVWATNFGGNNLSEFSSSDGSAKSGSSGDVVGALVVPAGIAGDTSGNTWAASYGAAVPNIVESDSSGGESADPDGFTGGGLNSPYGIAIDSSGNVWATNVSGNGSLSEFKSDGTPLSGSGGYINGGLNGPYGIAIDGAGNVWAANFNGNGISEFNSSGTAISTNGYTGGGLSAPYGIAVDGSGNVWVATQNGNSSLTEFVGAATPVVTPLSVGVKNKELGTRP